MVAREERRVGELNSQSTMAIWRCSLVVLLAIAFGYIEAAVVVYLRQIFYPGGFSFPLPRSPLTAGSSSLFAVEIAREAATIVLIFCAAFLSGQSRRQRLAYFLIIFAVWDLFYYVWLWVILGWPSSILDWDILFLIPLPWAGPVLAPVLVSLLLSVVAGMILYGDSAGRPVKMSLWDLLGYSLSGLAIITSFCIAGSHITQSDYASHFSWPIFTAGLLASGGISLRSICKNRKNQQLPNGKQAGVL